MAKKKRTCNSRKIQRYGSALDIYDASRRDPLEGLRQANLTPKKRCCKKTVRCKNCPLVVNKLQRALYAGMVDSEDLLNYSDELRGTA
ncbi:hypothetical protein C3B44_06200 [Corynebacterium yudongzhengii]|uniref:Uncharacterized protein n=1 Tax=Corynebacterium yudongzhengii TaxID=2080740 RepID=A0A2U1T624_9CORY|nr:hypothetical protein [Corynebacterium yudongzhengii]AWB81992.1 hypothetical protein C3B44_06200 [Corynebacterium yudongzhengii]PWC01454.1 hypothetical protein DF222_07285 [Corynebacterium yudongzhengii]